MPNVHTTCGWPPPTFSSLAALDTLPPCRLGVLTTNDSLKRHMQRYCEYNMHEKYEMEAMLQNVAAAMGREGLELGSDDADVEVVSIATLTEAADGFYAATNEVPFGAAPPPDPADAVAAVAAAAAAAAPPPIAKPQVSGAAEDSTLEDDMAGLSAEQRAAVDVLVQLALSMDVVVGDGQHKHRSRRMLSTSSRARQTGRCTLAQLSTFTGEWPSTADALPFA